MADHDDTQILAFDSLSPTLSSPSGSEFGVRSADGCGEFERTVLLDDTLAIDSLSQQTLKERPCFDTEPMDDPDGVQDLGLESVGQCETEVVADSEDEANCSTEVDKSFVNGNIGRSSDNKPSELQKKRQDQNEPNEDMLEISDSFMDQKSGSGANGEKILPNLSTGSNKLEGLNYASSQEPAESSEAKALDFVESFLILNDMSLSQEVEPIKTARERSVSSSNAKGIRYLAKRIKRRSPVREQGTFEWVESCHQEDFDFLCKTKRGDLGKQTVIKHQKITCIDSKEGGNDFINESENSKELGLLLKDTVYPSLSNSGRKEMCVKEHLCSEQLSKMDPESGSGDDNSDHCILRESSYQTLEASVTVRHIMNMYDVGIGTQIAAEAMEALACGARDTYHVPVETLATKNITHMERYFPQKDVEQRVTRRKRSARKGSKHISGSPHQLCNDQELDPTCATILKVKKGKQTEQKKVVGGKSLESRENYMSLSSSGKPMCPSNGRSKGKAILNIKGRQSEGDCEKETIDQSDSLPNFINNDRSGGLLTYKRKRKGATTDLAKMLSGKGCSSGLPLNASDEVAGDKLSERAQTSQHVATLASKLHEWIYPKRKRTYHKARKFGPAMITHAPISLFDGQENSNHSIRSQRISRDDKRNFDRLHMKELMHINLLQPFSENSSKSLARQKSNERESSLYDSDVNSVRVSPLLLDKPKKSALYTKVDYVDAESIIRDAENNKCGAPLNNDVETSIKKHNVAIPENGETALFIHAPLVYQRRSCNKNLPKSSLVKELIKLNIPYSIRDFKSKYLRRRRNVADVRVLFSQHLDDNIIKQQKKISARLGITITSDSKDATHFIADRFVRTWNMLEAIARAKPVVTHLWLENCGDANCLLDERNYILRDAKKEKEIGFTMPASLAKASHAPLLKGKKVFVTPNVKPDKETITALIEAAQGQTVARSHASASSHQEIPADLFILSVEHDKEICAPLIAKGAVVYSSELLLTGIITQKLDYERYKISLDDGRET